MTSSPLPPTRRGLVNQRYMHELERDPKCKSYAMVQELASPVSGLGCNPDKPKADTILAVFAANVNRSTRLDGGIDWKGD